MKAMMIPVTPFQQNCTLIWDEETMKGAVVDPGGEIDRILAAVEEQKVDLEKIIITHAHLDHAGGAAELQERAGGIPIEGPHEGDQFWIDSMEEQSSRFGFAGARTFTPDRWLHQGDQVTVGTMTLDVYHCPGHTPGHVVLHHPESKLALVGDVLFQGSIGRTDFPQGNHQQLIDSIKQNLWPLGDDVTFISGHGPVSTIGHERKTNPFVGDAYS